jgi:undecaprenyl pyrophosphate phosphatase UppP
MTSPYRGGNRRSSYLMIRVALIVALVVGGVVFHHRGHAYEVVRVGYLIVVVGFLVWRISMRQRRGPRARGPGPMI